MPPQSTRKYARMSGPKFQGGWASFGGLEWCWSAQAVPGAAIYALYASCVSCPFGRRCEICAPDKFQAQKVHENAILFSKNIDAHSSALGRPNTCRPQCTEGVLLAGSGNRIGCRIGLDWVGWLSCWVDQRRCCPIGYEMMRFKPGRLIGKVGLAWYGGCIQELVKWNLKKYC